MSIRQFDFYTFLKDIGNQSLDPLHNNPSYDAVVEAIAALFSTLYERVQEIKVENTLDMDNDLTYQNHLNNNTGSISQDIILEYLAEYLNTDHFKDTVAVLMRMYEYRTNGNQLNNLDAFVEKWIIPSFKFFTKNAGDLHKTKGTSQLLERLFEFYGQVNDNTQMFEGIVEQETEDTRDIRFNKFTSYRIGIDEVNLKRNYENIAALDDIQITRYIELGKHRYVVANGFLFISEKDRDDWWIVDILDDLYKMNDDYYIVRRDDVIYIYPDNYSMYDSNHTFLPPSWDSREVDVEFIPQIINVKDTLSEYHYSNFYWIEKIDNSADTFSDSLYNLKRWKDNGEEIVLQTIKTGMGIGYEPLSFVANQGSYPRITSIMDVGFLWLDFHDDNATSYTFDVEDVKMIYTFTYQYQYALPDGAGGFTYPTEIMLGICRDGYDYDHDTNGFYYQILSKMNTNNVNHYQMLERVVSSQFNVELSKLIANKEIDLRTAFDIFIIEQKTISVDNYYTDAGTWDASNSTNSPPDMSPTHGQYWVVSNDGDIELNGISNWRTNEVVVWNGNFGYWEKNNDIPNLVNGDTTSWAIDHKIIAAAESCSAEGMWLVGDPPILGEEVTTPCEQSGGMFVLQCSDIPLDINTWSDIIWVDGNAIETFGDNPSLLFCYRDATKSRFRVYAVKLDGFVRENDKMDLTRILRRYPLNTSILNLYKLEVSDKHLIAYCTDTRNSALKSLAIVLENSTYNIPLEFRNNDINISYDTDIRSATRNKQPWYRIWDDDGDVVEDEEVQAMKDTLEIYSPINSNHDSLNALIDMGFTGQKYEDGSSVENYPVSFPNIGTGTTKYAKEQAALKLQDSLFLRRDGDPDDVNCDCEDQRELLFVYDFIPMTMFYDLDTMTTDPDVTGYPSKVQINRVGLQNDEYSGYEDVCRFESEWIIYSYDDGVSTVPLAVRHKIRLNLYSQYQSFVPWCANSELRFNWGMHHYIEYLDDDPSTTISDWVVAMDEEIYMPIQLYNECNPVGIYYTTNITDDGSTLGCPIPLKAPWNVYDIAASKISLV